MAAEARVFIKFDSNSKAFNSEHLSGIKKNFEDIGKTAIDTDGKVVKSAKASSASRAKFSRDADLAIAASGLRRSEEEKKISTLSTKDLGLQYDRRVALSRDMFNSLTKNMDSATRAEVQARLKAENELKQIDARIFKARSEVVNKGAGGQYGILGLGRSLLSGGGGIESVLKKLLMGGAGMIGGGGASMAGLIGMGGGSGWAGGLGLLTTALTAFGSAAIFAVKQGGDMQDKLATLSAQSGITGTALDGLRVRAEEQAKKFHVDATDAVDAYRETINSLGLDVTKNIPLLNSMTNSVMTLSKASGLTAEESGAALGNMFNMFGGKVTDVDAQAKFSNIMNVLAAGARQANVQIPALIEQIAKFGSTAHEAGMSIEQTVALTEALGHSGKDIPELGNQIKALLLQMQAPVSNKAEAAVKKLGLTYYDINPQVVGAGKAFETLGTAIGKIKDPVERASITQSIFAKRSSDVAKAIFDQTTTFAEYTAAVTGTSDAVDMAAKRSATFNDQMTGEWEQIKNVGIDAFFKYKDAIDKIPGALDKLIPKLVEVIDKSEKLAATVYHIWEFLDMKPGHSLFSGVIGEDTTPGGGGGDWMSGDLPSSEKYKSISLNGGMANLDPANLLGTTSDGLYHGKHDFTGDGKGKRPKAIRTNDAPENQPFKDLYKEREEASKQSDLTLDADRKLSMEREVNAFAETGANEKQVIAKTYEIKKFYLDQQQEDYVNQLAYLTNLQLQSKLPGIEGEQAQEEITRRGDVVTEIDKLNKKLSESSNQVAALDHENIMRQLADEKTRAASLISIEKEIRDKQTDLIKNKYDKEEEQAINWYNDELARINKLDATKEQKDRLLGLLSEEGYDKITAIQDAKTIAEEKSVKNYTKVSEIMDKISGQMKGVNNDTKQWGMLAGAVAAALIERIPNGSGKPDKPIKPYKDGVDFVPYDGLAYLHKGESVITADATRRKTDFHKTPSIEQQIKNSNAASEIWMEDERDKKEAKDFHGTVAEVKKNRKIRGKALKKLVTLPAEESIKLLAGAGLGHFASLGVEAFEGTELGEKVLSTVLGKVAAHGLEHAGSHIGGDYLGDHLFSAATGEASEFYKGGFVRGYDGGGSVTDPGTIWALLGGDDPLGAKGTNADGSTKGVTTAQAKQAINGVLPDIVGALTYKTPPDEYNWNGTKKKPPFHSEALGLLGKLAPIAANLIVPGSGALLSPLLNSMGVNATGTKSSLLSAQGLLGMSGSGMAVAGGALGFMGLSGGGWTGSGGKYKPAGIVHAGEYVMSAESVDRIGVGNLESLHNATKGYASGGYVANYAPSKASHGQSDNSAVVHAVNELHSTLRAKNFSISQGSVYENSVTYEQGVSLIAL